ncbi:hypothetical protein SUGI_0408730 [Cryptomeria japonica]|nr:hypothetical protein SUGI_0408730 [Cryptomeria japonica]
MALLQGTRGLRLSLHICCSSSATEARVSQWKVEERYLKCCLAGKEQQPLRVAVLVSGGVDSSVALRLLCAAGHSCTAFYLKIWFQDDFENFWSACPWDEDLTYAKAVCDEVGVDLQIVHLTDEYWSNVVSYVISEYKSGRTPNPDVLCNTRIKFGAFMDFINKMDFDYVASGHYAHVEHQIGDSDTLMSILHLSADKIKDQTYFLCHLSQAQLRCLLFPLGCLTKEEVRKLAAEMGLPNKERKDSQGICFLGKVKFSEFVSKHIGEMEGILLEAETGDFLGKHRGFWFYTIGQRQGLRLPGGPWYVVEKDIENNVVFVSRNYYSLDKRRRIFHVGSLNWILGATPDSFDELQCKVRHGPKLYECNIELVKGNLSKPNGTAQDVAIVKLTEDDQGIAVGQFAAFYKESICLGSGIIIDSCRDHSFPVCSKALEIARLKDKSELREPVKIKNCDSSFARKSNSVKISNPVDEASSQNFSSKSVMESRSGRQIWVNLTNTVNFIASWFKYF